MYFRILSLTIFGDFHLWSVTIVYKLPVRNVAGGWITDGINRIMVGQITHQKGGRGGMPKNSSLGFLGFLEVKLWHHIQGSVGLPKPNPFDIHCASIKCWLLFRMKNFSILQNIWQASGLLLKFSNQSSGFLKQYKHWPHCSCMEYLNCFHDWNWKLKNDTIWWMCQLRSCKMEEHISIIW